MILGAATVKVRAIFSIMILRLKEEFYANMRNLLAGNTTLKRGICG
jgi:hypothetical protein